MIFLSLSNLIKRQQSERSKLKTTLSKDTSKRKKDKIKVGSLI